MGWMFGWDTRKQLVDHLCEGNGVKTLKRCFKGNNMWAVQEYARKDGETVRFACLYLIRGPAYGNKNDRYGWGYKDVDETMGPHQINFPVSWLDLLSPTDSQYALEWRKAVLEQGQKLKRAVVGSVWMSANKKYTVIRRRSPSSLVVKDELGDLYRISPSRLVNFSEVIS